MKILVNAALLTSLMAWGAFASELPPALAEVLQKRSEYSELFAEQAGKCFSYQDTLNPVFSGCVDWHSAVHAAWAVTVQYRNTGDLNQKAILSKKLNASALLEELKNLRRDASFEMPYGRAWFLRLAIEYGQTFDSSELRPLASEVYNSLIERFRAREVDPNASSYNDEAWALINLYDYAFYVKDAATVNLVRDIFSEKYAPLTSSCSVSAESETFMSRCLNRVWLASKVLDRTDFQTWIKDFERENSSLSPLENIKLSHQEGLNFSRSWAFWDIYEKTGDPRYLNLYIDHFKQNLKTFKDRKDDYKRVGHWVAQFGQFALAPLLERSTRK
ncbi:DUF2891 family protein [Agrobacterium tumefaciens]|uniref:DUF2891 family protein n=1 Tax=Agrobacterium tumefaciens TaxID=358 RepID=UPI00045AB260|nr:DUF2891 family protein [Agrobacterium tumefaciens]CDN96484.1 hypothetical protein BN949_05663 [Agrobacterium tumefaciens]